MRPALLAMLVLCLSSALAQGQGTFPLESKSADVTRMPALQMGMRYFPGQEAASQEPAGVPDAAAKTRGFFFLRLGDESRWAVYVPGDKPSLLVDTDGDRDLGDETPVEGKASGNAIDFGAVSVTLKNGASVGVQMRGVVRQTGAAPRYLLLTPGVYCTGTVKVAGKPLALAVIDGTMNGRFNDTFDGTSSRNNADRLAIDLNGDGTFALPRGTEGPFEVIPLAKYVELGKAFYHVTLEADGSAVTFEKAEPGYGTLDIGVAGATMMAFSDYGMVSATSSAQGTFRLPAGRYAIARLTLATTDDAGEAWQLTMTSPPKALASFEIPAGQTERVAIGPPLVAEVSLRQRDPQVYLGLSLKGQAGEVYVPGIMKGKRRLPPPTFTVLGEAGQTVYSGTFEYG